MGVSPYTHPAVLVHILMNHALCMKKISVLLVDDHTVVRQGLRALLQAEEDIEVVGEAVDGHDAIAVLNVT